MFLSTKNLTLINNEIPLHLWLHLFPTLNTIIILVVK